MLAVMDEQPTLSRLMGGQMDNPRPTSSSFNMQLARAANGHAWEQLAMQPVRGTSALCACMDAWRALLDASMRPLHVH